MTEANLGGRSSRTSARRRRSCTRPISPRRPTPMALGSNSPGAAKSRTESRSSRRFSSGVPVNAQERDRASDLTTTATAELAFLMRWASSITTTSHGRPAADGPPRSARTDSKLDTQSVASARQAAFRWSFEPTAVETRSSGAQTRICRRHCATRLTGQTISARSISRRAERMRKPATAWIVLPRPISSASRTERLLRSLSIPSF